MPDSQLEDSDLMSAVSNNWWDVVRDLLCMPSVRAKAAFPNNATLLLAAEAKQWDVVKDLLTIPEVRANAAVNKNYVLIVAIIDQQWDIVHTLLATEDVIAELPKDDYKGIIKTLVLGKQWDLVAIILTIDFMRANINFDGNHVLISVAVDKQWDLVEDILSIPAVIASLSIDQYSDIALLALADNQEKIARQIIANLIDNFVDIYVNRFSKLQDDADENNIIKADQKSLFRQRLERAFCNLSHNMVQRIIALKKILPQLESMSDTEFFELHVPLKAKSIAAQHNNTQVIRAMERKLSSFFFSCFVHAPDRPSTGFKSLQVSSYGGS